mmetsp:Transcript_47629/g.132158  ORF Transcript_47629/g.132158 Transcript_47629/m.132158 type:complete len:236 (+) Transcript_47629:79-786(+)
MHFNEENRARVQEALAAEQAANPEAEKVGHMSRLAEEWKALDEEGKKKYEDLAAEDKTRYEEACAAGTELSAEEVEEIKAAEKKSGAKGPKLTYKDSEGNLIKAPCSAYMHYSSENRTRVREELAAEQAANPEAEKVKDMARLAEEWKSLDEEGKKKYEDLAAEDKTRYEEACAAGTAVSDEELEAIKEEAAEKKRNATKEAKKKAEDAAIWKKNEKTRNAFMGFFTKPTTKKAE